MVHSKISYKTQLGHKNNQFGFEDDESVMEFKPLNTSVLFQMHWFPASLNDRGIKQYLPLSSGCSSRRCRCSSAASARRFPPAHAPRRGTAVRPRRPRGAARWPDVRCSSMPGAGSRSWRASCPPAPWGWGSAGLWRRCSRSGSGLAPWRWPRSSASPPPGSLPPRRAAASPRTRSSSAPSCRRSRCGSRRPRTWGRSRSRSSASPRAATWRKSSSRVTGPQILCLLQDLRYISLWLRGCKQPPAGKRRVFMGFHWCMLGMDAVPGQLGSYSWMGGAAAAKLQ